MAHEFVIWFTLVSLSQIVWMAPLWLMRRRWELRLGADLCAWVWFGFILVLVAWPPCLAMLAGISEPAIDASCSGMTAGLVDFGVAAGDQRGPSAIPIAEILLLATMVFWGRLAWRLFVTAIVVRASSVADVEWQMDARLAVARFGLRRQVPIRVSAVLSSPCTAGILRPLILVPRDGLAALGEEQRVAVLLHEIAHVARFDNLRWFVGELLLAIVWFHPMAWLARSQMKQSMEIACDRAAVLRMKAPRDFARALLAVAEDSGVGKHRAWGPAMACSVNQLERRIAMLRYSKRPLKSGAALAGFVLALCCLQGALWVPDPPQEAVDASEREVRLEDQVDALRVQVTELREANARLVAELRDAQRRIDRASNTLDQGRQHIDNEMRQLEMEKRRAIEAELSANKARLEKEMREMEAAREGQMSQRRQELERLAQAEQQRVQQELQLEIARRQAEVDALHRRLRDQQAERLELERAQGSQDQ